MKPFIIVLAAACIGMYACQQSSSPNSGSSDSTDVTDAPKDELVTRLEEKIKAYPDSFNFYNALVDTLAMRGNYPAATAICNLAIAQDKDDSYYFWFTKGDLFQQNQQYDSAIAAYKIFLNKFPDDQEALINLGNSYAKAGNAEALALADDIFRRFPNKETKAKTTFIKGVYANQVKQFAQARQFLDSSLIINHYYTEAYMEKGYSFYDEGKTQEALKTFKTLNELNTDYADGWYWKAKCEEKLGQTAEAINSYEYALALDPGIKEAAEAIQRLKK